MTQARQGSSSAASVCAARDDFAQSGMKLAIGKIQALPGVGSKGLELVCQSVVLTNQGLLQHPHFARVNRACKIRADPDKLAVERVESRSAGPVHKHAVQPVEKIVASGACDGPIRGQALVARKDLLGDNIKRG